MKTFSTEENKSELLQPAWLWNAVALLGILGFYFVEAFKTALWLPWTVYELLLGGLGPHVRNGFIISVLGTCVITVTWYFASNTLAQDPIAAQYRDIIFYSGVTVVYLILGVVTRRNAKNYGLL